MLAYSLGRPTIARSATWFSALPITHIHTFLVHPAKGVDGPEPIGGSTLALTGKMFRLLRDIYDRSDTECDVAISFNHKLSGIQQNECRDLLIDYARAPNVSRGRRIAERLATYTDNRPKMGLLFLVVGTEDLDHKLIISRFPADSGILAEQDGGDLNVEFLERIFMKSAKSYKAVLYRHSSFDTGFWRGEAIDKQMNDSDVNVSGYWINDFLDSDFATTSATGTRRLAVACRSAARNAASAAVKSEIVAAVTLASGHDRERLSANEFVRRLRLSNAAATAILSEMKPHLADERFKFSAAEFGRHVTYRSVELDNGGIMTAATDEFDQIFSSEAINGDDRNRRFTTEGTVVSEKLGKTAR